MNDLLQQAKTWCLASTSVPNWAILATAAAFVMAVLGYR